MDISSAAHGKKKSETFNLQNTLDNSNGHEIVLINRSIQNSH
jgi:hypothetical protein